MTSDTTNYLIKLQLMELTKEAELKKQSRNDEQTR
jgi:hypothetical protein